MAACPSCPPVGPAGGRGARHALARAGEGSRRRCGGWRSADRGGGAGTRSWDGAGDRWPSPRAGGGHTARGEAGVQSSSPHTQDGCQGLGQRRPQKRHPHPTPGPVSCLPPDLRGGRGREMEAGGHTGVPGTHRLTHCQQRRALTSTRLCQLPAVHTCPPLFGQRPERWGMCPPSLCPSWPGRALSPAAAPVSLSPPLLEEMTGPSGLSPLAQTWVFTEAGVGVRLGNHPPTSRV